MIATSVAPDWMIVERSGVASGSVPGRDGKWLGEGSSEGIGDVGKAGVGVDDGRPGAGGSSSADNRSSSL